MDSVQSACDRTARARPAAASLHSSAAPTNSATTKKLPADRAATAAWRTPPACASRQPTPSACTRDYRPVCGCDQHSYGNACEAQSNRAAVLHKGECSEAECAAVGGRVEVGSGPGPMCNATKPRSVQSRPRAVRSRSKVRSAACASRRQALRTWMKALSVRRDHARKVARALACLLYLALRAPRGMSAAHRASSTSAPAPL
jgi:hypothetical protein